LTNGALKFPKGKCCFGYVGCFTREAASIIDEASGLPCVHVYIRHLSFPHPFNEMQRVSASPEDAARNLLASGDADADVTALLSKVSVPTLALTS